MDADRLVKQLVADLSLDNRFLKDIASGNFCRPLSAARRSIEGASAMG